MCNYPSFHFSRKMWPQHPGSLSSFNTAHPSFFSLIWRQEKHLTFACKKHEAGRKWRVVSEKRSWRALNQKKVKRTQGADQLFNSCAWSLICMFMFFLPVQPRTSAWVNYRCLGLVSMVIDWKKTMIHALFTVGLFMSYRGWISNEQTILKKQVLNRLIWLYWFCSLCQTTSGESHQTGLEHAQSYFTPIIFCSHALKVNLKINF